MSSQGMRKQRKGKAEEARTGTHKHPLPVTTSFNESPSPKISRTPNGATRRGQSVQNKNLGETFPTLKI